MVVTESFRKMGYFKPFNSPINNDEIVNINTPENALFRLQIFHGIRNGYLK